MTRDVAELRAAAKGVYVIAPTPFHSDGRIDEASIDRMTDFFLGAGVTGMTVLGQLGEAPKMTHDESVGIVKRVIARAKVPIVVGVSAPGFAAMKALTQDVMALGASGVMIAPPNTLRTDDSIVQYYRQAAEAIGEDVPFVIQDYPLTFSVQMTPGVIRRIAAKPGADTPTTIGSFTRASTRFTIPTDSSCAILGASPSWPSTVMPSTPALRKKSVMRSMDDSSIRPSE